MDALMHNVVLYMVTYTWDDKLRHAAVLASNASEAAELVYNTFNAGYWKLRRKDILRVRQGPALMAAKL